MLDIEDSVNFEVALDFLGASRQPFMQAIRKEREKTAPSQVFIRYCEMRLAAIDELQHELMPDDKDTISCILDKDGLLKTL